MRNYIIGLLTGIAAGYLYYAALTPSWHTWILFAVGSGLVAFGFDVLFGSFQEHQRRAAWLGLALFGGPGFLLLFIVWRLAF